MQIMKLLHAVKKVTCIGRNCQGAIVNEKCILHPTGDNSEGRPGICGSHRFVTHHSFPQLGIRTYSRGMISHSNYALNPADPSVAAESQISVTFVECHRDRSCQLVSVHSHDGYRCAVLLSLQQSPLSSWRTSVLSWSACSLLLQV